MYTPPVKAATLTEDSQRLTMEFQSTPPVKAATIPVIAISVMRLFQSTPPVKAATYRDYSIAHMKSISIHAAREGGDLNPAEIRGNFINFNPRRP